MSHLKGFLAFLFAGSFLLLSFLSAPKQGQGDIRIEGQVLYNYGDPLFQGLKVEGQIFEDGKFFRSFTCDEKGRFATSVNVNHDYQFRFSMDYHGTTKVFVSTKLPPEKSKGDVGGIFRFKCEIFERVDGLNMRILNKPLIKIRYVAEKDAFEPDKAWTEAFLRELEDFKDALATLKDRKKKLIKDAPVKAKATETAAVSKEIAEKQPEQEVKKKADPHPNSSRNIMENLQEEPDDEQIPSSQYSTADTADEVVLAEKEEEIQADVQEEDRLLENHMPTIQVRPKREKLTETPAINTIEKNRSRSERFEALDKAEKQLNQIKFNNSLVLAKEKEEQLYNKQIQSLRLRGIITVVANEEKNYRMYNYGKEAVLEFEVLPIVRKNRTEGLFVDTEFTTLVFPTKKVRFKKETFLFSFNYYYQDGVEVSEEVYCTNLKALTKQEKICSK